jgi:hypothetical protein
MSILKGENMNIRTMLIGGALLTVFAVSSANAMTAEECSWTADTHIWSNGVCMPRPTEAQIQAQGHAEIAESQRIERERAGELYRIEGMTAEHCAHLAEVRKIDFPLTYGHLNYECISRLPGASYIAYWSVYRTQNDCEHSVRQWLSGSEARRDFSTPWITQELADGNACRYIEHIDRYRSNILDHRLERLPPLQQRERVEPIPRVQRH